MLTPATHNQMKISGEVELERPSHHTKDFLGDNPKTNSKIPENFSNYIDERNNTFLISGLKE